MNFEVQLVSVHPLNQTLNPPVITWRLGNWLHRVHDGIHEWMWSPVWQDPVISKEQATKEFLDLTEEAMSRTSA